MEKYLIEQYGVIEEERYLTSVDDIEDFVRDMDDLFDCGQGYYSDEAELILKIGGKFYLVNVTAKINSSKQEYGDRLYWSEGIESLSYKEIEKPQPKKNKAIENMFSYHPPKEGQPEKYTAIREKAKELACLIDDMCPDSRDKSLAITNLQQATFWANASIAINE